MQRIQRLSYFLLAASFILSLQMSWARTANFSLTPRYEISVPSPRIAFTVSDYDISDPKLKDTYEMLGNTVAGSSLARYLAEKRVQIVFGQPRTQGMAAVYIPAAVPMITSGTIMIGYDYQKTSSSVLAALLAHEAVHAQNDTFFGEDSVEQEYYAYLAQAAVWKELRRTVEVPAAWYSVSIHETNPENDFAVNLTEMSKASAYDLIYRSYLRLGVELPYN